LLLVTKQTNATVRKVVVDQVLITLFTFSYIRACVL